MSTQTYLNSPVRSCRTCVHREASKLNPAFDRCGRWQVYCSTAVGFSNLCGDSLAQWRSASPKPPRRSLRRWLYDLLFAP